MVSVCQRLQARPLGPFAADVRLDRAVNSRLKTLVLDANGFYWKAIAADTVVQGLLGIKDYSTLPAFTRRVRILRGLTARYDTLSYIGDWRDALCDSPALDVRICNITNLIDYARCLLRIRRYDLVIVLHSAAGDSMTLLRTTAERFRSRRGKLVVFIGNEYDLMAEKMEFLRTAEADFVCSQLPLESARWLYQSCGAQILPMPHALNPKAYRPGPTAGRAIDLGFRGAFYPYLIGDVERTRLIEEIQVEGPQRGLVCDIRAGTLPKAEWAAFLSRCKGTVGGESGSYYLDQHGTLIASAKAYLRAHPGASIDEIYERFFEDAGVEFVSGKCISSRHFEAIGTKTCQILLDGEYNGILQEGAHYIGVTKDLSNLDKAIERFKDEEYRQEIADRTHEYVLDQHTYAHRVETLLKMVVSS